MTSQFFVGTFPLSIMDALTIITLSGSILFGIIRRDFVMFTACLGLNALTFHHLHAEQINFTSFFTPIPVYGDNLFEEWQSRLNNILWDIEGIMRTDWNHSIFILMFILITFACLFRSSASNLQKSSNDQAAFQPNTVKRKLQKARFFTGCVLFYTIILRGAATLIIRRSHAPILDLLPQEAVHLIDSTVVPGCLRILSVFDGKYYREIIILMTLMCYALDARTIISSATFLGFLPYLFFSLSQQLSIFLRYENFSVPSYFLMDDSSIHWYTTYLLTFAHLMMYLAWMKTMRSLIVDYENLISACRKVFSSQSYHVHTIQQPFNPNIIDEEEAEAVDSGTRFDEPPALNQIEQEKPATQEFHPVSNHHNSKPNGPASRQLPRNPISAPDSSSPTPPLTQSENEPPISAPTTAAPSITVHQPPLVQISVPASGPATVRLPPGPKRFTPALPKLPANRKQPSSVSIPVTSFSVPKPLVDVSERRWEKEQFQTEIGLRQIKAKIPSICPIENGTHCIVYLEDNLQLWNIATQKKLCELKGHTAPISSAKPLFIPDQPLHLISSSWDGTLKIWDTKSGSCHKTLSGVDSGITCFNLSVDSSQLVAGTCSGAIAIWDLKKYSMAGPSIPISSEPISSVWITPDLKFVFATSFNGTVYVVDVLSGKPTNLISTGDSKIVDSVVYEESARMICSTADGKVTIVNLEDSCIERTFKAHSSCVNAITPYGEGQRAFSGSDGGDITVWNIDPDSNEDQDNLTIASLEVDNPSPIISLTVFEDAQIMFSYSLDQKLTAWDLNDGSSRIVQTPHFYESNDSENSNV